MEIPEDDRNRDSGDDVVPSLLSIQADLGGSALRAIREKADGLPACDRSHRR